MSVQGFLILIALAIISYKTKALDLWGTFTAFILGYFILSLGGWLPFLALLLFLISGTLVTKFKIKEKKKLGLVDEKCRSIGNVLGNGLAPLLFLTYEKFIGDDYGWAAVFASIATANADTLASEIGKVLGKNPRIILGFKKAKPGEEGAVSVQGEMAALFGAAMIAFVSTFITNLKLEMFLSILIGGFIGANVDSLIGATLEKKGITNNDSTNFLSTLIGGFIGLSLFLLFT